MAADGRDACYGFLLGVPFGYVSGGARMVFKVARKEVHEI